MNTILLVLQSRVSKFLIGFLFTLCFLLPRTVQAQATIASFTPASGPVGTSVTITGTNFNTTAANDVVFFGATKATVTAASATSLTVTVPVGASYQPITVTDIATGLTAYSTIPFLTTYTGGTFTFSAASSVTGNSAYKTVTADMDGDGKPDIISVNNAGGTYYVYKNTSTAGSTPTFALAQNGSLGANATSVAVGDLDGDGKPDLAVMVAVGSNYKVTVFKNMSTGAGSFALAAGVDFTPSSTSGSGGNIYIYDIDGDGKPDLVATSNSISVSIFPNTTTHSGAISFSASVDMTAANGGLGLAIGDIDGDGKPDIATGQHGNVSLFIYHNLCTPGNISTANFTLATYAGSSQHAISMGDVDGDGKLDVVAYSQSGNVQIYRNTTATTGTMDANSFAAPVNFAAVSNVNAFPYSLALGDLDGDGKLDIALGNETTTTVSLYHNLSTVGNVNFAAKQDITGLSGALGIAIDDMDGDGKPDIVVPNSTGSSTAVIRTVTVLTVTSVSPATAAVGASVTLTGTNFNATAANNAVFFGATKATVTAASATSLTVTVPAGATYAPIMVVNTVNNQAAYSTTKFLPTYTGKGKISTIDIVTKTSLTGTANPRSVTLADMDGDGLPDLVYGSGATYSFAIARNIGTAGAPAFNTPQPFAGSGVGYNIAIADFNGDGKLDLVATNTNGSVSIYPNTTATPGTFTFGTAVAITTATAPQSIAVADIDGDGKLDLAVGSSTGSTISLIRNTSAAGTLSFSPAVNITGASSFRIALADLDADGLPDLIAVNISNSMALYRNTATPNAAFTISSFTAAGSYTTGTTPSAIAVSDFDGDGKPDIAVANAGSTNISLFRNTVAVGTNLNAGGAFDNAAILTTGSTPGNISVGDIDGDGKPDIAVTNQSSNTVSLFHNQTTSGAFTSTSFSLKLDFSTGTSTGPTGVVIGDIDGDGKADVVTSNFTNSTSSIFLNAPVPAPTTQATNVTFTNTASTTAIVSWINGNGTNRAVFMALATTGNAAPLDGVIYTASPAYGTSTTQIGTTGWYCVYNGTGNTVSVTGLAAGATYRTMVVEYLGTSPAFAYQTTSGTLNPANVTTVPGPVVTAFSPATGAVGTTVTITGTGFSPTAANNIVFFGLTKATITGGGATSLTATVPVGTNYGAVTVLNTDNALASTSATNFAPTYTGGKTLVTAPDMTSKADFSTGTNPKGVAMGDLDGDGKPDIVVTNSNSNTVSVFHNSGTIGNATFDAGVNFTVGSGPAGVTLVDIDGDGKLDIAVTNAGSSNISLLRNTSTPGNLSFVSAVNFTANSNSTAITARDLDGDGKPELIVASSTAALSIYYNMAATGNFTSGTLAAKLDLSFGSAASSLTTGDIDGDGKPDIIFTSSVGVSVVKNISTSGVINAGSFASAIALATGGNAQSVAVADIDGDGKLDIVTGNNSDGTVSILRNRTASGTISFETQQPYAVGSSPQAVAIGDINGDGKLDIIATNGGGATASVLTNTSTAGTAFTPTSFATKVDFVTGTSPNGLAVGDIDGDGKPDIVAADLNANTVSVLLNNPVFTPTLQATNLTITNVSPTTATLNWVNGNGANRAVFIQVGSTGNPAPVDGTAYTPNAVFSTGGQIGTTGWYNVYAGTGTTVNVTDLPAGATFTAMVVEYNGTQSPNFAYLTTTNGTNTATFTTGGAPTITAFSPASGLPGSTITITGTNFSTTAAHNVVYFGATKASVTAATTTSLTVTVPNGATFAPITALNTDIALAAYSVNNFLPSYTGVKLNITGADFTAQTPITATNSPQLSAISDIDGDGKPDLITVNSSATVSIYRNLSNAGTATASFDTKVDISTGTSTPVNIAVGDIDGDGKPDIVISNGTSNSFSVCLNTSTPGNVSFAAAVNIATSNVVRNIAIGDLDGDGRPDVLIANQGASTLSVFRNISPVGAVLFAPNADFALASFPESVAVGDLDGDGKPDVAITSPNGPTVSVFKNNSTAGVINLSSPVTFTVATGPKDIVIADMDGDSKPDIIVASAVNAVNILHNITTGNTITTGSFEAFVSFPGAVSGYKLAIADIDGDGKPDIAESGNVLGSQVAVLHNLSTSGTINSSSFDTKVLFGPVANVSGVSLGDLNADGKPDLAIINSTAGTINVLINNPVFPPTVQATNVIFSNTQVTSTTLYWTNGNGTNRAVFILGGNTGSPAPVDGTAYTANSVFGTTGTQIGTSGWYCVYNGTGSTVTVTNLPAGQPLTAMVVEYNGTSPAFAYLTTTNGTNPANTTAGAAPAITSISPLTAVTGASVTITGTGFSLTAANNIVYFGATRATVTAVTPVSVTVTVPAGATYGAVTLLNKDVNLAAYSAASFLPTYPGLGKSGIAVADFSTALSPAPATGGGPTSTAMSDLDGDGKPDLVVANSTGNTISLFRNRGSVGALGFDTPVLLTTATPYGVAVADIDGDGKPDLVVTNAASNTISVFINTSTVGTLTFAAKVNFTTTTTPHQVTIADFDGDGKPDVAVANSGSTSISVFRNTSAPGTASFATRQDFSAGVTTEGIAAGDLDGDGRPDLVATSLTTSAAALFRNTSTLGTITFVLGAANLVTGTTPKGVTIGDLDGDGKPDVIVANSGGNNISIFRNIASSGTLTAASFNPALPYSTTTTPYAVSLGDFDGDGKPDLAVALSGNNSVAILRNLITAPGTFTSTSLSTPVLLSTTTAPRSLVVGDLDGDGLPDIAAANFSSATVSVFRNNPTLVPVVTSFSPLSAAVGATVTINGSSFNTTAANNVVFFGAAQATVSAATATSLTVSVPTGATYGPITVLNKSNALAAASMAAFTPTYTGKGSITAADMGPVTTTNFTSATTAMMAAVGDVDGDGKPDIVATTSANRVVVLINTGTTGAPAFTQPPIVLTIASAIGITLSDLDGDGRLEIIAANSGSSISVYRNTSSAGAVAFLPAQNFTAAGAKYVAVADIDGDGKPDVIVSNTGNNIAILKNTSIPGTIVLGTAANLATGGTNSAIAVGDIDGDGKPDIAAVNTSTTIYLFRNVSVPGAVFTTNTFSASASLNTSVNAQSIVMGDIDGDGKLDLITSNSANASVSIYRNISTPGVAFTGSNVFGARLAFTTATAPAYVALGDIDGDGKPDVVSANGTTNGVSVFHNSSTSGAVSLSAGVNFGGGNAAGSVVVADIDGDGKPDVLTSGTASTNNINVLLNSPSTPPTTQATNIAVTNLTGTTATLSWVNGNGTGRAVFVGLASTAVGTPAPTPGTAYTANPAFGSGSMIIGTGWFSVYNGTGNTVDITGLAAGTGYRVMVLEYNGTSAVPSYNLLTATGNPATFGTAGAPSLTTNVATNVTTTSATLNGAVNDGGSTTAVTFEYSPTDANTVSSGGGTPVTATPSSISAGAGNTAVSYNLTGLTPSTTYYYRVVGVNGTGTIGGTVLSFGTTMPLITTSGSLTALTSTVGTTSASINFSVGGTNITGGITATAPTGFEISTDNITFGPTATIAGNGTITPQSFFIRLSATAAVGTYPADNIVLTSAGASPVNFATISSTVNKITSTLSLSGLAATYNGAAKSATVTTSPANLTGVAVTYNGSATVPTEPGTYAVVASLTNANYTATNATGSLVIAPAIATITLNAPGGVYDGTAKSATATTTPAGLSTVNITYNGVSTAPTGAGTYGVLATLTNSEYVAANVTGSLVISPASATISLSNLTANYDGTAKPVTVTTVPAGLSVAVTYNGSTTVPTVGGTYAVVATLTDPNYAASNATGNLVISKGAATITLSNLTATYNGTAKAATATTNPANLTGVTITYNGSATAPTAAGTYAVVASLTNDAYAATDATGSLVISPASATISLSGLTVTYDGTAKSATATTNPVGLSGVAITYNGSSTAPTEGGTYAVVASLTNTNYTATNVTGSLVISPISATITLSGLTATYDGTAKAATATTSPAGLSGLSITYNGSTTVPTEAGTYTVVASLTNNDYTATNATSSLVINPASATITLSNLTATYDGTAKSATSTTNPVGLGVAITYDGNSTAPTAAGTYAVVASLTNSNYTATNATGSLVISPASAIITLSGLTATYDGTAKSATATTNPAGLSGVTITYGGSSTAPIAAGTYAVVASLTNANYTATNVTGSLVISPASAIITLSGLTATYDGTAKSATATTNPAGLSGVTITYGGSSTAPTATGTYAVVASLTNANYTATNVTGSLVISPASAIITLSGLTATYDGTAKSATATTNPAGLSGVTITYGGSSTAPTAAGTYAVVASLTNVNYTATNATGSLVISPASATITLSGLTATYDGTAKSATATTNPAGLSGVSITYDGSSTAPIAAGTYAVVASLTNVNYTATNATGSLVISPASATITLSGLTATYDGTAKSATATTNPAGLSGVSITYDGSSTAPTAAGTYAVVASLTNSNYTATNATGSLVISQGTATISLSGLTATYDGTAKPATATTSPAGLSGASITYGGSSTVPTAAGTYAVVASLTNANYTATNATGSLVISPATATITLSGLTATYDGTAKSATATTSPAGLSGVSITYGGSATAPTAAGTYAVVASLTNGNYTATNATGSLVISPATSTAATLSNASFVYDGTAKSLTVANLPTGATVAYTGNSQTNVGTYTVTAVVSQANFADQNLSAALTITNATSTAATLANASFVYDGTAKSLTVANLPTGATVAYTGNLQTNVGGYTVTAVVSQANYADQNLSATLTITSATSTTATLANASFVYDGTAKSLTVANLPTGATVAYTGNLQNNVGAYTVTAVVSQANYADQNLSATLTITSATSTTATLANASFVYDGTAKSLTVANLPTGATVAYTGNLQNNVGAYTVTAVVSQANYADQNLSATLTITSATSTTATLANASFVYDGTAKSLTVANLPTGATVVYTGNGQTNVGTYTVNAVVSRANFADQNLSATLTIGAKAIAVTAATETKTNGDIDPAFTYTYSPALINGDSFTGSLNRVVGESVGSYAINQNTLALSANYTLSYTGALFTITPAANKLTFSNGVYTYDGTIKSLTVNNVPAGATVSYSGNGQIGAGVYTITALVTQAGFNNQTLTATLTINKAPLTITAVNQNRLYGAINPAFTVTYSGFASGDNQNNLSALPVATTTATTASSPGSYAITPNGAAANNYAISYVAGILKVIPLTNANMNNLTINAGTLSPVFSPSVTSYTISAPVVMSTVAVTPTFDPTASAAINGASVPNGSQSNNIPIATGSTIIPIEITAQDGVTKITYTITVNQAPLTLPVSSNNILSPNGDGKNDGWVVKDIQLYPDNVVTIIDRAGRTVYTKKGYGNDWTGTVNSAPLAPGTYYYTIELGNGLPVIKGFITILKARN